MFSVFHEIISAALRGEQGRRRCRAGLCGATDTDPSGGWIWEERQLAGVGPGWAQTGTDEPVLGAAARASCRSEFSQLFCPARHTPGPSQSRNRG